MSARITVIGNVASIPQLRQTSSGRSVTNFRIASTDRHQDRESGRWVDGARFFVGVACWGALGENVAASIRIGMPVVVTGRIAQRSWTDHEQKSQTYYEISADTVAPDLRTGTATFTKVSRSQGPAIAMGPDGQPVVGLPDTKVDVVDEHPVPRTVPPTDLLREPPQHGHGSAGAGLASRFDTDRDDAVRHDADRDDARSFDGGDGEPGDVERELLGVG